MNKSFSIKNMRMALIAAGLVAISSNAFSASVGTAFQVSASVNAQCSVLAANMSFPAVDPLGLDVDASTTVTVKCTKNSSYTVGLSAGATSGATIGQRRMVNSATADYMNYNLYTDGARSTIWGDSALAPAWVSGTGAGMGTAQVLTVYGRVPTGQTNLAVGSYLESSITVTVTY